MTHDVRLSVCHNFPYRAGYISTSTCALVNCISQAQIKVLCVCQIGLYAYTNTAYRRTYKVKKVNKGSEGVAKGGLAKGGWQKNGRAKKMVQRETFAIPILLLYNNIILFAALAGRTFLQPTEFLMADHTPFLRLPLSLSFHLHFGFCILFLKNIATTASFYSSVYSSLHLSLYLTPKLKRFQSFSGMIPESFQKRFRNIVNS